MMKFNPFAGDDKRRSWFWWGINIGILLALFIWWWLENKPKNQVEYTVKSKPLVLPDDDPKPVSPPEQIAEAPSPEDEETEEPDNLRVIEGIGPRSAQVLSESGIQTFAKLAAMDADDIQEVLRAAGVRVPYPETWPEQAALAAAGKWDVLKDLQGTLKGGRRV